MKKLCQPSVPLKLSHTRANWQAESSTSYELGWFSVNSQRFRVHSWQVEGPTEIVGVYSVGQWQPGTFLAGYPNCSCLQNKRVLLDIFIVHLSREQTLVSQGAPVWHHELACRKSWQCVRLDYRSRVADALEWDCNQPWQGQIKTKTGMCVEYIRSAHTKPNLETTDFIHL